MENKMNKFGFEKMLAVLAVVFACGGMWGCSFEDGSHKEWAQFREGEKIIGFLSDSLVIVSDYRRWYEVSDEDGDIVSRGGIGRQALNFYNYRVQEKEPRWIDSIDNGLFDSFNYFGGQLSDSVIWGRNGNQMSFWKVHGQPYKINIQEIKDACTLKFDITKMRAWFDGSFVALNDNSLMRGGDSCQYAILDTIAGILAYKRLDENLEWIKKCNDVRVHQDKVECFIANIQQKKNVLVVDKVLKDSLKLENSPNGALFPMSLFGKYVSMGGGIFEFGDDYNYSYLGVYVINDGSLPAKSPRISFKDKNAGEIKY